MKSFGFLRTILTTGAVVTASSGCGGGMQPAQLSAQSTAVSVHARQLASPLGAYPTKIPLLFQANVNNGQPDVQIFRFKQLAKTNPLPVATITDALCAPQGLAMDKAGTLYVANGCGETITEYPLGQETHSVTITDGLSYPGPDGLAIGPDGTLYVTEYPRTIVEYPSGSTSPSGTITSYDFNDIRGVTVDKKSNLYLADAGAHTVWEVSNGGSTVTNLNLQGLDSPDDVKLDRKGNLWVSDSGTNYVRGFVNVYPKGSTTAGETITGFGYPYWMAVDKLGTVISNTAGSTSSVDAYKPGQYTPYAILTNGVNEPAGIVIKP